MGKLKGEESFHFLKKFKNNKKNLLKHDQAVRKDCQSCLQTNLEESKVLISICREHHRRKD